MSGVIQISNDKAWMVASWVYDNVLELVQNQLKDESGPVLSLLRRYKAGDELRMLSLDEASVEELTIILEALRKAFGQVQAAGPQSFASPEFYPGFMEHFRALIEMVSERVSGIRTQ